MRENDPDEMEARMMTSTATASREQLKGIFDIDRLKGSTFKITVTPISEAEAEDMDFRSLKGIAGKPIDRDEIRRERLKL